MNWKKFFFTLLTLILAISVTACSKGNGKSSTDKASKGRFVEAALPIEDDIQFILGFHKTKEGHLEFLYVTKNYDQKHKVSKNQGVTWEDQENSWLKMLIESEQYPSFAAWDKNDTPYVGFNNYDEKTEEFTKTLGYIDEKNKLSLLPFSSPSDISGADAQGMKIAPNGDFLFDCTFSLIQTDSKTGEVKTIYEPKNVQELEGYAVYDDTLALSDGNIINLYSLETGKKQETITCKKSLGIQNESSTSYDSDYKTSRSITFDKDGNLYFADSEGIFHYLKDSTVLEQIVSGDLTSLTMPSLYINSLVPSEDGSFLILSQNNENYSLLSYKYDKNMPTLPEEELTVYTLEDNQTIRQAIGLFSRQNPNVHVTLELGIKDESDSLIDVMRLLTTRLMSGEGPDILVLDSLPISSYQEKGILMDLAELLKEPLENNELYSNAVLAYQQQESAVYAVPARFEVPMMFGDKTAVEKINDLDSLLTWLKNNRDSFKYPLICSDEKIIIRTLYPVCSSSFTLENGSIDMEGLSHFLSNIKELKDMQDQNQGKSFFDSFSYDFEAISWLTGAIGLDIGNVGFFQATYAPQTVITENKKGAQATLFNQNTFIPNTILGINSQSRQTELAKSFVQFSLSEKVLQYNFKNGLPVSVKAMDLNAHIPDDEENPRYSFYGSDDGSLNVKYPKPAYNENMKKLYASLDNPYFADNTVLTMILEETSKYFSGDVSLDSTMALLENKINTYLSEQETY